MMLLIRNRQPQAEEPTPVEEVPPVVEEPLTIVETVVEEEEKEDMFKLRMPSESE